MHVMVTGKPFPGEPNDGGNMLEARRLNAVVELADYLMNGCKVQVLNDKHTNDD